MVDEKLKKRALRYYHRCHNMAKTLRKYPYCSRSVLYTWLKNEGNEHVRSGRPSVLPLAGRATAETKAREKAFCVFAYLPKVTVQASIGGITLSMGLSCGGTILAIAVLAIVITAPIGGFLIDIADKKWRVSGILCK